MGRLYWKFFLFLWLSQVLTAFGVGLAIWLTEVEHGRLGMDRSATNSTSEARRQVPPLPPSDLEKESLSGPPQSPPGFDRESPSGPPQSPPGFDGESPYGPPQSPPDFDGESPFGPPQSPPDFDGESPFGPPQSAPDFNRESPSGSPMGAPNGGAVNGPQPPPDGNIATNARPAALPVGSQSHGPESAIFPPLLPLLAGSLVSLLFAALLARYFSRPIRTLRQAFRSVAEGRLGTRVGQAMGGRRDELADLGTGFDDMANRLQGLVEDRQRLLHDVSHELRSPLARLQAAIDLMQQQPDRVGEFVARVERESSRIDRLVGEVLTLARLDNGIPKNQMMFVDLNEVVEAIADDAAFEAEIKQCRVITTLPGKACMFGSPDLLHRAIENIVRNAIRHTQDGSSVTIDGQMNDDNTRLFLEIMDEGEGVPESDLRLIFEPFYRSPTADRFKGYGIGMAIARRVVDAHKGSITAANKENGGLKVTIALPLSSDADC